MIARCLGLALITAAAAGCASTPCSKAQPYERAVAYPYLKSAPGVAAPTPSTEFAIPELANDVDFAKASDEEGETACLEVPAALPAVEEPTVSPRDEASEPADAPAA